MNDIIQKIVDGNSAKQMFELSISRHLFNGWLVPYSYDCCRHDRPQLGSVNVHKYKCGDIHIELEVKNMCEKNFIYFNNEIVNEKILDELFSHNDVETIEISLFTRSGYNFADIICERSYGVGKYIKKVNNK